MCMSCIHVHTYNVHICNIDIRPTFNSVHIYKAYNSLQFSHNEYILNINIGEGDLSKNL